MSTQLVVKSSHQLAATLGIEVPMMVETVKAMCFPSMRPENISDAQMAAFLSVCVTQDFNPLISGMVYAYPTKSGGIVPVIGPDGVFKKLGERKDVTYECEVFPEDVALKPTHAKATIWVEGKPRPYSFTAIFAEWVVGSNPNWNTRPRHMLWVRAIKQCARQVIHGLPMDDDEAALAGLKNVTGTGDQAGEGAEAPKRPEPKAREKRGVAAVAENRGETPPADAKPADPKPAAPAAGETAPIEIVARPVVDSAAGPADPKPLATVLPFESPKTVTPAAPATPAAKAADTKPAASAKPAVVALVDGKEVTIEGLIVDRFVVKPINKIADSVEAQITGAYTGIAYHFGGACAAWQIEKPVTLRILGKMLKSGVVAAMVQSIELTPEAGNETVE